VALAHDGRKAFLLALTLLIAIGALTASVAWWFMARVRDEVTERPEPFDPVKGRLPEIVAVREDAPAASPLFVVRLRTSPAGRTQALIGGRVVGALDEARTLDAIESHARDFVRRAGKDAARVRGQVEALASVPSTDVVRVVDVLIAADVRDVTFLGTPPPGSQLEALLREAAPK
jgi:hypothetical protein